jgi:hypothetical protein
MRGAQAYCFRNVAELKGQPLSSYRLCVHPVRLARDCPARGLRALLSCWAAPRRTVPQTHEVLSVDFVRVVRAHASLAAQYVAKTPLEFYMAPAQAAASPARRTPSSEAAR